MKDVRIRDWKEDDALQLYQFSRNLNVENRPIFHYFYPEPFLHALNIIHFYQQANPQHFLYQAIVYKQEVCGFLQAERKSEQCCEIAYWMGSPYRNLGIMESAIELFCEEIFLKWEVLEINARVKKKNTASHHVLIHNGFQSEAIDSIDVFKKYR